MPTITRTDLTNAGYYSHHGPRFQAPREFSPSAKIAGKGHDEPEYVLEWNLFTTLAEYESFGKKHEKWDECKRRLKTAAGGRLKRAAGSLG